MGGHLLARFVDVLPCAVRRPRAVRSTIYDVARVAGVSVGTVLRVMDGHPVGGGSLQPVERLAGTGYRTHHPLLTYPLLPRLTRRPRDGDSNVSWPSLSSTDTSKYSPANRASSASSVQRRPPASTATANERMSLSELRNRRLREWRAVNAANISSAVVADCSTKARHWTPFSWRNRKRRTTTRWRSTPKNGDCKLKGVTPNWME